MVPAGVRMDLADGSMQLPDEVGIPLNGRKRLYGEKVRSVILERSLRIPVGRSDETAARIKLSATEELWVTRGDRWRPTVTEGPGRIRYQVISNIGGEILRLDHRFVSVGSRRYREWQNLALESTVYTRSEPPELIEDMVDPATENRTEIKDTEPKTENLNCQTQIKLDPGKAFDTKSPIHPTEGVDLRDQLAERAAATTPQDAVDDEEIYYHESGNISAEDLEGNLAVLPEIPISTTAKVSIEDLQVGDSGSATPEEIERLRQIIWKKRHLLIGKENAFYPLRPKASCVISMSGMRNRSHCQPGKCPRDFGLLAAEIIRPSTSPWASPIVIVRKSNGVDIRLCIDYKLVNSLTRLMVYPMPLISDLLEDLDKAL
ncbi:reverse transcriptase, partial [Phytophthora megakarya]